MKHRIKEYISFSDSLNNISVLGQDSDILLLIDENVWKHYYSYFIDFKHIIIQAKEENKSLATVEKIIRKMLDLNIDKKSLLIGIGGGIITDITGLVATLYMRGIRFGFFPTTLLSMCDASIGGKNGVNIGKIKNAVGTIHQPEFVINHIPFIKTLKNHDYKSGLGEVIKHSFLLPGPLYKFLISNKTKILAKDENTVYTMINHSIDVKATFVNADENETHIRQLLNFGHSIAHAIELDGKFSHGECVCIGMYLDTIIAHNMGICSVELLNSMSYILNEFEMPITTKFNASNLLNKILKDKKKSFDSINYILPYKTGRCKIIKIKLSDLEKQLTKIFHE